MIEGSNTRFIDRVLYFTQGYHMIAVGKTCIAEIIWKLIVTVSACERCYVATVLLQWRDAGSVCAHGGTLNIIVSGFIT